MYLLQQLYSDFHPKTLVSICLDLLRRQLRKVREVQQHCSTGFHNVTINTLECSRYGMPTFYRESLRNTSFLCYDIL
jgi:hypothetical protein